MTGLEKLRRTAALIESASGGDYKFSAASGMPYISGAGGSARLGLQMSLAPDLETKRHSVSFTAYLKEMGVPMNAAELSAFSDEVWRMKALLTALDTVEINVSNEELWKFGDWLEHRETRERRQSRQNYPAMGM